MVNNRVDSEFKDFLRSVHSKWNAGKRILDSCVRKVSSESISKSTKIMHGEANVVYDVVMSDGPELIVRIAPVGRAVFERERWAIESCRSKRIPVPEILDISRYDTGDQEVVACIQKKLPGRLFSAFNGTRKEGLSVARQCGVFLRDIHTIKTTGVGYIDGEGKGKYETFDEYAYGELEGLRDGLIRAITAFDLQHRTIIEPFEWVQDRLRHMKVQPNLIHNDFDPRHILVDKGSVCGIIDFGEASSEDPINDLTRFSFYDNQGPLFGELLAGYGECDLHNLIIHRIIFSLCLLVNNHSRGFVPGAKKAIKDIYQDWERLEKN
jgi:aminoglycoside phosphotransferase (APT) family kinase protein